MSLKQQIIEILESNIGKAVLEEDIADKLSVDTADVRKTVSDLTNEGYDIETVNDNCYLIAEDSDELSSEGICSLYENCPYEIEVKKEVTSTNSIVKTLARQGKREGYVLFACSQTEGRGRLGRRFISPDKTGIYMSLLLRPKLKACDALYITTSAGVAVSRAIESISEQKTEAKIKWVNDIFVDSLKVSGILTEASIDFKNGYLEYAVLGIGINLYHSESFEGDLSKIAGGAFKKRIHNLKNRLSAKILKELVYCLDLNNRKEIISEYQKRSYLDGKKVKVICEAENYTATVVGIDDEARLIVKTSDGLTKTLSSGEVSLTMGD